MSPVGFEPTISAGERPKTYALDRAATGIGHSLVLPFTERRVADKHLARPEGNKLQRQKILSFIYPIYNHNWSNSRTIYIFV